MHLFMNSNSKYESQVSVNIKPTLLIYQVESNICLDEMYIFSEETTDNIISFCFLLIFFKPMSCRIKTNYNLRTSSPPQLFARGSKKDTC